jgi:hypothetical protein
MASYSGTKSQREERIVLVWLAGNDSTVAVLCSRKEGGGRSVGWSERLLQTAQSQSGCVTRRSATFSRAEASEILRRKMAEFGSDDGALRSRVAFSTLARQWEVDVLATKYKHSTQKNHQHRSRVLPTFHTRHRGGGSTGGWSIG